MCFRAGKENNGFDPNIQLVPGGSWNGPKPAGGAAPPSQPSAGARPPGAPAPATTFTLPSGGWASGPSAAAPPPSSAQEARREAQDKKDFPELGAAPKPAAPPAAPQSRAGMGPASGQGGSSGWAARPEESSTLRPAPAARARTLGKEWAEDDDDGMDFSKPIVISRDDEAKGPTPASGEPLDPKEQAKMLAMKQQAKLAQMQEDMAMQANKDKDREKQALESEQRQLQGREEERRREMEQRRKEQEEADAKRRAEMEARRAQELVLREEQAKKREEEAKKKEEEAEKERQRQKELLETQSQLMAESREAARLRRQQEEEAAEAERKARAAEKLAELDRKRAEKLAAEEAERAKRAAEAPPPPPKQAPPERAGMGSILRADERRPPPPRASPWSQQPTPDPDAERKQWEELRRDDRPMPQGNKPESRPGYNQASFGTFANRGPNAVEGVPARPARPERGQRQPFENSAGRFDVEEMEPGALRKQMAEREKLREKQAAKDAVRKEQADKEAAEGPSRTELKRMALEERRKREAARRAREAEVAPEEIQNADPQRGATFKGKTRGRSSAPQHASGVGVDTAKGEAAVDDLMAMPINNDFLTPQPNAWTGSIGGAWGRSPEKGDEGDRGKMQDANDVAARSADFLLDDDEHSPEKLVGMASASAPNLVGMSGGGFGAAWPNTVAGAGWGVGPSNGTWDGGTFGAPFPGLGFVNPIPNALSLPSHPVWDSASAGGLPGSDFHSQWANVPRGWSAQTSLQTDAFQAGVGENAQADRPSTAPVNRKQNGNQDNKGKQQREPKSARGGKGPGQKRENAQLDSRAAGKVEDNAAASAEATASGAQQGAGRGSGKGGRGGHSDPSNPRQKQPRTPRGGKGKAGAGADGDAGEASEAGKEGKGDKGEATIKSRGPKPELFSKDIKQRAAALVKEKESQAASSRPATSQAAQ
jgi:hypothetical protein